jgi:predicted nucleic acid-binding Zn finger protein
MADSSWDTLYKVAKTSKKDSTHIKGLKFALVIGKHDWE